MAGATARPPSCAASTPTSASSATAASSTSTSRAHPTPSGHGRHSDRAAQSTLERGLHHPADLQEPARFLNATGSIQLTDTLSLKSNLYYRGFWQKHVDGNTSDVVPCDPALFPGFLCFEEADNPLFGLNGLQVPATVLNGGTPGSIDRTATNANGYGSSVQATSTAELFGRTNNLVVGASVDRGQVNFKASSELGVIGPDLFVTGTGVIINQPDGAVGPANLNTGNTYYGLYLTDTIDVTPRLSITAGGRFNLAQINLADQLGAALNGAHQFTRFNPVIGATYKITPDVGAYAGYSEANRAPTPAELACADPARPCLLDNFLVSDPPLKQVVARTYEAGLRGIADRGSKLGRLAWNLGLFHHHGGRHYSMSPARSPGAASSRMRAARCAGASRRRPTTAPTAGTPMPATTILTPPSSTRSRLVSGNPFAVDGLITVTPGNVMPAIPAHRVKAGFDYAVLDNWKVGADLIAVSGEYLRGDESNLNPMLPGYWLVNLHTSYKVTKEIEVFGLVQNLFDRRYYTFGTFFETDEVPFLNLKDPHLGARRPARRLCGGAREVLIADDRGLGASVLSCQSAQFLRRSNRSVIRSGHLRDQQRVRRSIKRLGGLEIDDQLDLVAPGREARSGSRPEGCDGRRCRAPYCRRSLPYDNSPPFREETEG